MVRGRAGARVRAEVLPQAGVERRIERGQRAREGIRQERLPARVRDRDERGAAGQGERDLGRVDAEEADAEVVVGPDGDRVAVVRLLRHAAGHRPVHAEPHPADRQPALRLEDRLRHELSHRA